MRRLCTKSSRFFVIVESPHSSLDLAQLGNGLISSGKSWSPSFEALGLRSSVRWAEGLQERFNSWFLLHSVVKLLGGRVHLLRAMWKSCVVTCLMTMYGIELWFTQLDVGEISAEGVKDILDDVETRRRWLFMFIARYDTYAISLLADEASQ